MSAEPRQPTDAASAPIPTDRFDYDLPPELIAQRPAEPRDASRLLVLDRATGRVEHAVFREIGRWLRPGDLLVVNRSRVVPARLAARRRPGWRRRRDPAAAPSRARHLGGAGAAGPRLAPGAEIDLDGGIVGRIVERTAGGGRLIQFSRD